VKWCIVRSEVIGMNRQRNEGFRKWLTGRALSRSEEEWFMGLSREELETMIGTLEANGYHLDEEGHPIIPEDEENFWRTLENAIRRVRWKLV
jgi:hypothetical protein